MEGRVFYNGYARVIEAAVLSDESMPAKDFLESLGEGEQAKRGEIERAKRIKAEHVKREGGSA